MARVKQDEYEIITEDEIKTILGEDIDKIAKDKSAIYKYYINLGCNAGIKLQDAEVLLEKAKKDFEKAEEEGEDTSDLKVTIGNLEKKIQTYAQHLWEANYNLVEILTKASIKILFFYSKEADSDYFEGSYLDENFIKNVLKYSPSEGFKFSTSGAKSITSSQQKQKKKKYPISKKAQKLYGYAAWVLSSADINKTHIITNKASGITLAYKANKNEETTTRKGDPRTIYKFSVNYDNGANDMLGMYFYKPKGSEEESVPGYYYYYQNSRIATNYGWIREHTLEYCKKTKGRTKASIGEEVRSILSSKTDTEEGYKKGDVNEYQVKGLNTKLMSKASVKNLIEMFKFLKKNETRLNEKSIKDIFYKDNSKALRYIISHINRKRGKKTIDELIDFVIPKTLK